MCVSRLGTMLAGYSPVTQALLGTLFTWGLTAAGAALVFIFSSRQVWRCSTPHPGAYSQRKGNSVANARIYQGAFIIQCCPTGSCRSFDPSDEDHLCLFWTFSDKPCVTRNYSQNTKELSRKVLLLVYMDNWCDWLNRILTTVHKPVHKVAFPEVAHIEPI